MNFKNCPINGSKYAPCQLVSLKSMNCHPRPHLRDLHASECHDLGSSNIGVKVKHVRHPQTKFASFTVNVCEHEGAN